MTAFSIFLHIEYKAVSREARKFVVAVERDLLAFIVLAYVSEKVCIVPSYHCFEAIQYFHRAYFYHETWGRGLLSIVN